MKIIKNKYNRKTKKIIKVFICKVILKVKSFYIKLNKKLPKLKFVFKWIISSVFPQMNLGSISVIIPTYKDNPYIYKAVDSVLSQKKITKKQVTIIIVVNGDDLKYYEKLKNKYCNEKRIIPIYIKQKGLSVARNEAMKMVKTSYFTFLDDDDFLESKFIFSGLVSFNNNVDIVCLPLTNFENNNYNEDTYINKTLKKYSFFQTNDYNKIGSLLSSACAKIYSVELIKKLKPFNENVTHTEDILFWIDNIEILENSFYCLGLIKNSSYIRRILSQSMSRPSRKQEFDFYITDRIQIIEYIDKKIFLSQVNLDVKKFYLNKINAQSGHLKKYYKTLDSSEKEIVKNTILNKDIFYLNKNFLYDKEGIAFCHNFSPYSDTSAYVATKRLGSFPIKDISWTVIHADMINCRKKDLVFEMFYTQFIINDRQIVKGISYFNEKAQNTFGEKAFAKVNEYEVPYIYSRSMFAGSHVAAKLYKEKYKNTIWYAEFSDPLYMDVTGSPRETTNLPNFWKQLEIDVYKYADKVIFTNKNQMEYMISYNRKYENIIRKKAIILEQPTINRNFCEVYQSEYKIDKSKINIAYFGNFYPNRSESELLTLLKNPKVVLHFFVSNPKDLSYLKADNVMINKFVSHFEFLNIANKMSYLFVGDVEWKFKINPFLPSKLADYLVTNTKILAKISEGSVMSLTKNNQLIKFEKLNKKIIESLSEL